MKCNKKMILGMLAVGVLIAGAIAISALNATVKPPEVKLTKPVGIRQSQIAVISNIRDYKINKNGAAQGSRSMTKKAYTTEEADKRGIEIMEVSGTWGQTMEEVLPYMSNAGIDRAVEIYNQKHDKKLCASDYYNNGAAQGDQPTTKKAYTTEEADKRGIEIMEVSGTWGQTMEEVLPYMSNAGIDRAVEIYNQKHDNKLRASDYYNNGAAQGDQPATKKAYTTEEADKRGIEIMEVSGTWGQTMEEVLPYMSNAGIDRAVEIYNQKHDNKLRASDYYNNGTARALIGE